MMGHSWCDHLDADTCDSSVPMQLSRDWKAFVASPHHGRVNRQAPRKCKREQSHGSGRGCTHRAGHPAAAYRQNCGREVHPKAPAAGNVREPGTPWICGRARSWARVLRTLHPTRIIRAASAGRNALCPGSRQKRIRYMSPACRQIIFV